MLRPGRGNRFPGASPRRRLPLADTMSASHVQPSRPTDASSSDHAVRPKRSLARW